MTSPTDKPRYKTGHDLDQGYVTIKAYNEEQGGYEPLLAVAAMAVRPPQDTAPVNATLLATKAVSLLNGQEPLPVPAIEDGYLNYDRDASGTIHIRHRQTLGCSEIVLKICPHKTGNNDRAEQVLATLDQLFMKDLMSSASLPRDEGPQARSGRQPPQPPHM